MRYLLLPVLVLLGFASKAQDITKQQIDGWLLKCDTAYKTNKIWGYALNKKSYEAKDSVQLNADLKLLKNIDLLTVDPFWNEEILEMTENPKGLYVLIITKGKQSIKTKRSVLKTSLMKFIPQSAALKPATAPTLKEPVLLINGVKIPQPECYNRLSKIKFDAITDIYYSKHPIPADIYGQNAKNGVVTVWVR